MFGCRPYLDSEGKLIIEKNEAPMPVFMDNDNFFSMGSDETNGYLFCVTTQADSIRICASHALADGRGIFFFTQLVIYNYLKLSGIEIDGAAVPYSEADDRQGDVTERLSEACAKAETSPDRSDTEKEQSRKVFLIPEEYVHEGTPYTRDICLSWDQSQFMEVVHRIGTTPVCFMAALMGDAVCENYDLKDKAVVASVPVDMRAMLGSVSQTNFTANISIPFGMVEHDLTIEEKTGILRRTLKELTVKEKLVRAVRGFTPVLEMIAQYPLVGLEGLGGGDKEIRRTYLLSNIGQVTFPVGMDEHIRNFSLRGTNMESTPAYVLLSGRGRGSLIMQQNYDSTVLPEVIQRQLEDYGIRTELTDNGCTRCHYVNPELFGRK
ncbi:MAG: hypothetical protein IJ821_07060 [Lachnospiraceae bacterium]|nr:hypothetical protein [Lachnospiraceae bacterium]